MLAVTIDQISKSFEKGKPVLADIALEIEAGELFFLLGPSGCGKSTLLRLLAGFLAPDSGRIRFGDKDITDLPPEKRETAMVFQSYALWPHMTVAENVAFGLDVRRLPAAEKQQRVAEALATVDLGDLAERKIPSLSGGQQQRVALARALVVRPSVLLLDEPLSNLDAKLRLTMRSELRRICKGAGLTTIYVTHDQKEALSMADRMAVLEAGRIQQIGTPRQAYLHPANRFVADFIGESNFVEAKLTDVGADAFEIDCALGRLQGRGPSSVAKVGEGATLCLRPESIHFLDGDSGETNCFPAKLVESIYLGEISQSIIELGRERLKVFELHPRPRQPGDTVQCRIDPDDLILIAPD